jgi:nucleotide-binding universal stress UspA family protein
VGEVYFVLDGNHRVSVARQEGFEFIEAHIIEVQTTIPLTPDVQPDDLIIKAEYAEFLAQTDIATLLPNVDLSVTVPGQYEKVKEHIDVHRYFMGIDRQREITYPESVKHWYEAVYLPLAEAIRERGMLRWFPERTLTDLYLWVSEHRAALESELGWSVSPQAVVTDLANKESPEAEHQQFETGNWRKDHMLDRYTSRLFKDILIPLGNDPESWQALEQALSFARHEGSKLHGLHIVSAKARMDSPQALELQTRFNQRCEEADVTGNLVIESGNITQKICERALLTDLVVMNVSHPPAPGLSSLGSGLRSIIWRSSRPIFTLKSKVSEMKKALLAFDGSTKSREALFIAAYLGEQWQTEITVLTVSDGSKSMSDAQDYARHYLDFHELKAEYILTNGPLESILTTIKEYNIDLVLMGGYSGTVFQEVMVGSTVNYLLRKAGCPLFICR